MCKICKNMAKIRKGPSDNQYYWQLSGKSFFMTRTFIENVAFTLNIKIFSMYVELHVSIECPG